MLKDLLQYLYAGCWVAVIDDSTGEVLARGWCGTVYDKCFENDWSWKVSGVKDAGHDELHIYVKTGIAEEA